MLADLDEAFRWMESLTNLERSPDPTKRAYRLDRMRYLLEAFGNPQRSFRSLHVAGSKGKGSTSTFLAHALQAMGFRTGLYTSPHLLSYRERATQAGRPFSEESSLACAREVRDFVLRSERSSAWDRLGGGPTTFEILTLWGFLLFRREVMDWAVVETGLGGRLDATNVLEPQACILTPIELEHTDILGSTLSAIASEKAGIIKPGAPVFCAMQSIQALAVFRDRAAALHSPLAILPEQARWTAEVSVQGTRVFGTWSSGGDWEWHLAALGRVQADNAALAALTLRTIFGAGADHAIRSGLESTRLPGRLEVLGSEPPVVVDGAHTALSASKLAESFGEIFGTNGILLFGAFEGKDIPAMARALAPGVSQVIVTTPGTFRPSNPQEARRCFEACGARVELIKDTAEAWHRARELGQSLGRPLLVAGSFYLAGEAKRLWAGEEGRHS